MSHALAKIRAAGFVVELEDDQLLISPFSKLTQTQLEFLKINRSEIIEALNQNQAVNDSGGLNATDDRHYCHECQKLINGRCFTHKFRPVDNLPRRCADYIGGA